MKTTETIIENNCNINDFRRFTSEEEFVIFCQQIFSENENHDTQLNRPETYLQCLEYIRLYCGDLTVLLLPDHRRLEELEYLVRRSYNEGNIENSLLRMHLSSALEVHTASHLFKYQDAPKLAM